MKEMTDEPILLKKKGKLAKAIKLSLPWPNYTLGKNKEEVCWYSV